MSDSALITYEDINWLELWQNGRKQKSWDSKGAADWDKKACSFAQRHNQSPYVTLLLSRLPLEKSYSVLDIGCGPGTLALPLAHQVASVTALDYSAKMIELMITQAETQGLTNLHGIQCSWEDNWEKHGIEPADLVIASRSMNLDDLGMAIDKLARYARKYVFITDRIAPSPFDPEVFQAIGRDFNSGPDYIFTLNILYTKNIHPNVEILQLANSVTYKDMNEALESYKWMIKEMSTKELAKLTAFLESRIISNDGNGITIRRRYPPRWALIWWKKEESV